MNNTLGQASVLANYYTRGTSAESLWHELAHEVVDGVLSFEDARDVLFDRWRTNWDRGDDEPTFWAVHERVTDQLQDIIMRIEDGLDQAPLAVVRPDIEAGVMIGLGIHPGMLLTQDEINNILSGHRADGEKIDGKRYAVEQHMPPDPKTGERAWSAPIGSYDFCPTPHKSVSVSWAFAPEVERAKIMNAHLEAAREAVAYIADKVGQVRSRVGGGEAEYEAGAVAWIEFTHHTSRKVQVVLGPNGPEITAEGLSADPNIHTHFLIPNAVWASSGRVGPLDTMAIRGFIFEADGYYQARLATKLRGSGFDVVMDERTGAARMTIVPEEMSKLMSKRSGAGEDLARAFTSAKGEIWEDLSDDQRAARTKAATQSIEQRSNGGKDPVVDFDGWRKQVEDAGWQIPASFEFIGPLLSPPSLEQRHQQAYNISLPWLAERLEHRAVVPHWDCRLAALRGLVQTGAEGISDIDAVTKVMRDQGVMQYGEKTGLVWGQEDDKRYRSVTTELHESQENEFVLLARGASRNKSGAIPEGLLKLKIETSGLDFTDAHGRNQRRAIEIVGMGGKFGVVVATAGAGKTTSLKPLVAAWNEMGKEVFGASLASRQTDGLADAGIKQRNLWAFPVMMTKIAEGHIKLNENCVMAIDEMGLLGTRQMLELLRYREKYGFQIIALGDDKQCQAIQAGAIIDLSRRALGAEQVPEILTTKRQQTDREKEIVKLLRDGEAAQALAMKRADGTAEMAYGGRDGVMKRVAGIYAERLQATGVAPSISAPTNFDAHQVGEAVRQERSRIGLLGENQIELRATDGDRVYQLKLAVGDRVRLFESTKADVGKQSPRAIGRNGDIMDVISIDAIGARLRNTRNDKEGAVKWSHLPMSGGRTKLAYGYASTIHTSQGSTASEHIFALPSGSQAITGATGYTASTRHTDVAYIVTSEAAERIAVRESRAINDMHEVTLDDKWANVAKNLVNQTRMDSALALFERVGQVYRGTVKVFHDTLRPNDPRKPDAPTQAPELVQRLRMDHALRMLSVAREADLAR